MKSIATSPRILIILFNNMGSITARIRGLIFSDLFKEIGWTVEFIDIEETTEDLLAERAIGFDAVYLLKIPYLSLISKLRARTTAKIIFDLTDALWMPHHRWNGWQDLEAILTASDAVFSDNEFVASYGRRYNSNVHVIPACTQVERFAEIRKNLAPRTDDDVVAGWVGTASTMTALDVVRDPLERLSLKYPKLSLRLLILGLSDMNALAGFKHARYSVLPNYDEDLMIREVLRMDIGIFPPPCGLEDYAIRGPLKALIYMTGGVAPVCQNAGVCSTLIQDGTNGMLANNADEWERKLEELIASPDLRRRIGRNALRTVERNHSLRAIFERLVAALKGVLASTPSAGTSVASIDTAGTAPRHSSTRRDAKKVLIACSHFWPSIGGIENRLEQFSAALVREGYDVSVMTPDFPGRTSDTRNGVSILSIDATAVRNGVPEWPNAVRSAVTSGDYDACILVQDPLGTILWSVEGVVPPPSTRLILQPIINADGFGRWKDHAEFRTRLAAILRGANVAVALTRSGPDTQFMRSEGIAPAYLPNASSVPEPAGDFRQCYGIPKDRFMVLHVANLYWVKNHCGLLDALNDLPDSWQLVMVGRPSGEPDCAKAVKDKLALRPEVLYIPGLSREWVSAAMKAADVIVLSSFGEGSPNTILEAMAQGKPWIATPQCGAANDNAGGIISNLADFRRHLAVLQSMPDVRRALGEIGRLHWQESYSWDTVVKGWTDIIETGATGRTFTLPENIAHMNRTLVDKVISAARGVTLATKYVNIGMITFNRLEFTRQSIESIVRHTDFPHTLTVIDNNSQDGTREYLLEQHRRGIIKNLVLLDENVGVAKASNLAWSLEPAADYYLKLDNDIIIQKTGWLSHLVDVIRRVPQLGAVGYNFEPTSYPLHEFNGCRIRLKEPGNLGGACILIPKRTEELLGNWCEDYGLYGEEDADYGFRIRCAGLLNAYMEDEEIGFHLPAGKAAAIDSATLVALDGQEEDLHADYRKWKDELRRRNVHGPFKRNLERYARDSATLFQPSRFAREWLQAQKNTDAKEQEMAISSQPFVPGTAPSDTATPQVSIIIPLYNKVEYTRQCLEALALNTEQALNYEVILVDNASSDGTAEYLRTLSGDVTIVTNLKNLGFAKACNQGGRIARGRCLVFLNNDTIPHPGWLAGLLRGAEQDGADIVGARLLYPNGRAQHAGVAFNEQSIGYHIFNGFPADAPAVNRKRFMQCVTAACMLVKQELFAELGGFDEGYVNGFEDVDFCLRAGERGRRILYAPESVLIHFEETSEGRKDHDTPNIRRFLARWEGKVRCDHQDIYRSEGYRAERQADGRLRIYQADAAPPPTAASAAPQQITPTPATGPAATTPSVSGREKALALKAEGRYVEAIEHLVKIVTAGDNSVLVDLGDCLASLEKYDDALALYEESLALCPTNGRALVGVGVVRYMTRRIAEAADAFSRALEADPADPKALCGLGMARCAQGRNAEGFELYGRALEAEPENLTAVHESVRLAYELGRFSEAARRLESYLRHHPGDIDILFACAGLLHMAGRNADARNALERLMVFSPEYSGAMELLAKLESRDQEPGETATEAEARRLKEDGKYEEALAAFSRAAEAGDSSALADMGDCLAQVGRLDEATARYLEALDADGTDLKALVGLGVVSLVQGKQVKAVTWFNKALKADPANAKALCGLGMVRNMQNKHDEAFGLFARAMDTDPEGLTALHELIRLSYATGRFDEAGERLDRYLMHHPADLDMVFAQAGIRFKAGRYAEALSSIETVLLFASDYEGGRELREAITQAM
ncbi:hypothetical protein A2G06_14230 [Geobacter anodireducens]|nr:hypothetical protein A2G06_14230 [Geobacter anodireducens]